MATINIFVGGIDAKKFSGGLLTIFEYANGLVDRGHTVNVIPITTSANPQWYNYKFNIIHNNISFSWTDFILSNLFNNKSKKRASRKNTLMKWGEKNTYAFKRATEIERFRNFVLPEADITIATLFLTALVAHLFGSGKKYYFIQHFEPYFADDLEFPAYAEIEARLSYSLPLSIIANSSWLASKMKEEYNIDVPVCLNAINHSDFYPEKTKTNSKLTVISYGGRGVRWKGFEEAAEAIKIARQTIPELEWQVYGEAALPSNNTIAPYIHLGFISGSTLRQAYSNADIVLCSSWYESFPLFPLEAMACGTAVITTPYGTEDYAFHQQNAWVVPPKDPDALANAILMLAKSPSLRSSLASQGAIDAKKYTWTRSVETMEKLIVDQP